MRRPRGTLQTSVRLEIEVKGERMRDSTVDDSTSWQITSSVLILGILGEESHIVTLGADNEGDLRSVLGINLASGLKNGIILLTAAVSQDLIA